SRGFTVDDEPRAAVRRRLRAPPHRRQRIVYGGNGPFPRLRLGARGHADRPGNHDNLALPPSRASSGSELAMTGVQETPQIFMLLTVLCVFTSLIIFAVAAYRAIRGRRADAMKILVGWGIAAIAYVMVSAGVSFFKPRRVIEQGQNWCFDDWCIAVERVTQT